jgi:ammonium transporter, Amt family
MQQTYDASECAQARTKRIQSFSVRFRRVLGMLLILILMLVLPTLALADGHDSGDTAWMLTSTALVLFMTIPGLALFYGGLVRTKNVLSVLMQCFSLTGLITIIWVLWGYSLAFDTTGMAAGKITFNSFVGGFGKLFLKGVGVESLHESIPETVFITFQLTFAIITPALIAGAFAERMKFSAMLLFMAIWSTIVYMPLCHMAWSGDGSFFGNILGAFDFAGGTVVHINAGIAALVIAILIGKRIGYPDSPMPPHSLTLTVVGASMLWVGWFGFNAGSAVAANTQAGMAMLVTHISTATAALAWMFVEWSRHGKPSVLGIVTGAVAGLVAITPASGHVGPMGALVIGLASGVICFWGATSLKRNLGYDDSLDAFGVHGIGGAVGCLLTGIFAAKGLGGSEDINIGKQLVAQFLSIIVTVVYCGVLSFIILKIVDAVVGLRVDEDEEYAGLDLSQHDERGYNLEQ